MTMLTARWLDTSDSGIIDTDNFADRISDDDDALLDLEEDYTARRKPKNTNVYIWLMAKYPVVIALISLFLGCMSFVTLVKHPLPNFDDPTAGFEARGTPISGAHRTLKLMKEANSFTPNITVAMKNLNISSDYLNLIQHFMDNRNQDDPPKHHPPPRARKEPQKQNHSPKEPQASKQSSKDKEKTNLHTTHMPSSEPSASQTVGSTQKTVASTPKTVASTVAPTADPKLTSTASKADKKLASHSTTTHSPEQSHTSRIPLKSTSKSTSKSTIKSDLKNNLHQTSYEHDEAGSPNKKDPFSQIAGLLKGNYNKSSNNIVERIMSMSKDPILRQKLLDTKKKIVHQLANGNNDNTTEQLMRELMHNRFKDNSNGVMRMKMARRRKRSEPHCYTIATHSLKIVFEEKNGGNLWTAEAMRSICELQDKLILPSLPPNERCSFVSLPNLIAKERGKKCKDLNSKDLEEVGKFIRRCSAYACLHGCPNPAKECIKRHGNPLTMAYYLMDKDFFEGNYTEYKLKYTMLFYNSEVYNDLPDFAEYYEDTFAHAVLENDVVKITGIYTVVDEKFDLFSTYMMEDLKYFLVAGFLVLSILTVCLGSVALIIATLINVLLSLGVAYFFYTVVLRISFFPFLNVLAGIILIAVGADDVFIYYDTWQMVKKKNSDNAPQERIVARTFRHATVSILVTSLTTSGAFFANYISRIAAIRCFGVFAGLAILANFFFMVTWTPSTIALVDQIWSLWIKHVTKEFPDWLTYILLVIYRFYGVLRDCCSEVLNFVFSKAFPFVARRLWLPCMLILAGIGVCGFVVVFVKPRLKLPDSKEFPLFPSSHPMENYDQKLRGKFKWQIEKAKEEEMTVLFVWGAYNEDNGNRLDPDDDGYLQVDPHFSLVAPESQVWMKKFCNKLRYADFAEEAMAVVPCLLDIIEETQQHVCSKVKPYMDMLGDTKIPLCCEKDALPYSAEAFQKCFPLLLRYIPDRAGSLGAVMFDDFNNITGFLISIRTKQNPTTAYEKMDKLVSEMNEFLAAELATAPEGLKNGWYMGRDSFILYDLQNAISHGTYYSIELSLAVACITMFLCTLNVFITFYSIITISFAIAVTIGSLVLLGWQLNIVESVTISLAVGLSIDFTIHYGVAYVLAPAARAKDRVEDSFIRVGPAVAMAALTTFVAGASVMPSRILAYQELGLFLMLVMATSWVYANFFFQSFCAIAGPKGNFCQIPLPWKGCKNQQHYENPAAAEQLDIHSLSSVDSDEDDDLALILNG